jgi:type IV pilus assembly protein PilF
MTVSRVYSLVFVCLVALTGCVTVQEGGGTKYSKEQAFQAQIDAGVAYLNEGNMEGANRHLAHAKELRPNSPELANAMAMLYGLEGEEQKEQEQYKKALQYDPHSSKFNNNYAAYLYKHGQYQEAIDHLKIAEQDPLYDKRQQVYENLGLSYLQVNNKVDAERALQHAVKLNSNNPRVFLELASLYFEKKDYLQAYKFFNSFSLLAKEPSPRGLWLGIQLERVMGNKELLASYGNALQKYYPGSDEYRAYRESSAP